MDKLALGMLSRYLENMTVELQPETGRLAQEEIKLGHARSMDDLVLLAVKTLQDRRTPGQSCETPTPRKPRQNLADFLLDLPFAGSDLDLERHSDNPQSVEL